LTKKQTSPDRFAHPNRTIRGVYTLPSTFPHCSCIPTHECVTKYLRCSRKMDDVSWREMAKNLFDELDGRKAGARKHTSNKMSRGIVTNRLRHVCRRLFVPELAAELEAATFVRFLGGAFVVSKKFTSVPTKASGRTSACTIIAAFSRLFLRVFIHVFVLLRYLTIASTFDFSVQNMAGTSRFSGSPASINLPHTSCHSLLQG